MKKARVKKGSIRVIAAFMTMVFAIGTLNIKAKAQEIADYNEATTSVVVKNEGFGNDYGAQPLTTMFDCEIILAFTLEGLEMTFTTSCVDVASVIGVKDIKVQQKMWYGWKTVMTSMVGKIIIRKYLEEILLTPTQLTVKPTGLFAHIMPTTMFMKK